MSLPHVLLGLLHAEPRTGWELARALEAELDPAWSAGLSQIYPALARLRRNGWVRLKTLGPRRGPPRLLYRATAAGRRELQRWILEPAETLRHNDPLLARLALLDALPAAGRRPVRLALAAALSAEEARLAALEPAEGFRGLARRGAAERHAALRRFLESGGAAPPGAGAAARRKPSLRRGRGRMIGGAREEP